MRWRPLLSTRSHKAASALAFAPTGGALGGGHSAASRARELGLVHVSTAVEANRELQRLLNAQEQRRRGDLAGAGGSRGSLSGSASGGGGKRASSTAGGKGGGAQATGAPVLLAVSCARCIIITLPGDSLITLLCTCRSHPSCIAPHSHRVFVSDEGSSCGASAPCTPKFSQTRTSRGSWSATVRISAPYGPRRRYTGRRSENWPRRRGNAPVSPPRLCLAAAPPSYCPYRPFRA